MSQIAEAHRVDGVGSFGGALNMGWSCVWNGEGIASGMGPLDHGDEVATLGRLRSAVAPCADTMGAISDIWLRASAFKLSAWCLTCTTDLSENDRVLMNLETAATPTRRAPEAG